jgi:diguanylate cyclase (GGDEF)-like protein
MRSRSRTHGSRHWSVGTHLLLIVLAGVIAVGGASAYGFLWSSANARAEATSEMSLQATRAASSISASIATARKEVEGLAAQPGLDTLLAHPAGCTLTVDGSGAFPGVRLDIVRTDGRVACSSAPSPAVARRALHAGSPWLPLALRSPRTSVHWNATDAATGKRSVVVATPVKTAGATVGTVALLLHVSAPALAHDLAGPHHESFTIVDATRHAVVSPTGASVTGSRRLFASAPVPAGDWRVYAGVPRAAVLADARGALTRYLLVGLLALLVLAGATWILNRRVAVPLRAVTAAVVRAGRGAAGARVAETGSAELVALAREFNSMLDLRAGHDAQLVHQATHDQLTGLPNKTLLRDQLDCALRREDSDATVAVLCIGLNRLHVVNDGFGHDAADRVLVDVAARLSAVLPAGDTLGRFGGDEFVVLCEGVGENAEQVSERLHRCLEQPFHGPDSDLVLQAAIGIAVVQKHATNADQILREAHTAMREAKSTGRASCHFNHELQVRATQHLAVEHALWQALERDEFVVHYQPLLDVASRRIVGAEALVRWQHPERGLVPPMEFIPVAEATGQITAIGRFVLTQACEQAAAWTAAGHPLRISVNVAVDELHQDDFPDAVARVLSETGLAPRQLCLEITESSLMRATAQGSSALDRLRKLGVHLAIDDFGTGYSSLSYLHELPVDELKIDRSFIGRLDRDTRDKHLVEAIIRMADALGLAVVAEGVETDQQLQFLTSLGCALAQGYLFAAPQPADQFASLLDGESRRARLVFAG